MPATAVRPGKVGLLLPAMDQEQFVFTNHLLGGSEVSVGLHTDGSQVTGHKSQPVYLVLPAGVDECLRLPKT